MDIEYRDIPGSYGYIAGSDGSILSRRRTKDRYIKLNPYPNREGYLLVTLGRVCGKKNEQSVHRIILSTFIGPCPEGMVACHNDGNKKNNSIENLRWDTQKSNAADKIKHGTLPCGDRSSAAKLTEKDVIEIRKKYASGGITMRGLGKEYGKSSSIISYAIHGWKHIVCSDV